ncbi:DUF421 domain-containing protein [Altererythrobacter aquiaggeris]|uniref:DUF421 domain-containing protein n=1 Tax=Aestuarierythrobacter aquiaggeris TaxID=1898396 RepID=UPI003016A2D0
MFDAAMSALLFYVLIVLVVRMVGKRSTAQLNNFDWIINITVGSIAASAILLDSVPAIRAAAAIISLAFLQFALTWLVLRYDWAQNLVKAAPTMLAHKGELLDESMRKTRISEAEICSVLRQHGMTNIEEANWVILETDGQLTVIPRKDIALKDAGTMGNVETGPIKE